MNAKTTGTLSEEQVVSALTLLGEDATVERIAQIRERVDLTTLVGSTDDAIVTAVDIACRELDAAGGSEKFRVYHLTDTRPRLQQETSHNYPMLDARRDASKAVEIFQARTDTSEYRLVAEVEASSLEGVFERTNTIEQYWWTNDGVTRMFSGHGCRSTSVGDIVIDGKGDAHFCASLGWEPVGKITHHLDVVAPEAAIASTQAKHLPENLEREGHYVVQTSSGLVVDGPYERVSEVPLRFMGFDGGHRVQTGAELRSEAKAKALTQQSEAGADLGM